MSMLLRYIVFLHSEHLNSFDPCGRRWFDDEAASSSSLGSISFGLQTKINFKRFCKISNSLRREDASFLTILVL